MPVLYDVPLIGQPNDTACWAAALAMVTSYWKKQLIPAEQMAKDMGMDINACPGYGELIDKAMGQRFRQLPPANYTADQMEGFLIRHGPLWLVRIGSPTHAIVLRGRDDLGRFMINNPSPVPTGQEELANWATLFEDIEDAARDKVGNHTQLLYRLRA